MAYLSSDERRQHILEAAIEVVATEGLAAATTRRIAEKAGAPLGAMHYCFKNKAELVRMIAEEGAVRLRRYFAGFDPSVGLEATIRNDIATLWKWYQDNMGLQLALLELGIARLRRGGAPEDVYAMWGPYGRDIMREHLAAAQRQDTQKLMLPVNDIVRFILHRFDGLILEYAASRDRKACQRQVNILADAIVQLAIPRALANDRKSARPPITRRTRTPEKMLTA